MRRRAFLAATVLAPSWLRRAFADASLPSAGDKGGDDVLELEPVDATAGRRGPADVGRALRRARVRGRPLAVIVVPEREAERWQREELIGGYLRRGTAAQLAPLGGADVICATLESLRRAGLSLPTPGDDALFVRVAPDGRADSVSLSAGKDELERVATAAARLFPLDGKSPEERAALGRVALRLREGPLPGGNWGYTEGCGRHAPADAATTDDVRLIGCGMGSIGGPAHRFLSFFVEQQPPPRRRRP
jgi:hypothetical protein